ncbi:fimbrial protein [Escherichia coli]|nr:fimbrial protein [Escherichia coli]
MKKSLIALAMITIAFPGVVIADWVQGGSVGTVEFGGKLIPSTTDSPWEVMVGDAVSGLDANAETGQTVVTIPVSTVIPVLGIRNTDARTFVGQSGVSPQIDFNGAIDTSAFSAGRTTLTLEVKNTSQEVIGSLSTDFTAVAERSFFNDTAPSGRARSLYAPEGGYAFYGGIASTYGGALYTEEVYALAAELIPDVLDNYERAAVVRTTPVTGDFSDTDTTFSGYYASGIQAGENITIILNEGVSGNSINWSASLPVTVTYM